MTTQETKVYVVERAVSDARYPNGFRWLPTARIFFLDRKLAERALEYALNSGEAKIGYVNRYLLKEENTRCQEQFETELVAQ